MKINLVADSSVGSAPVGFTSAVQAAANVFEQDFAGNYTVNISYGWGTINNASSSDLTDHPNYSLGGVISYNDGLTYRTVKELLVSSASLDDERTAVASLPADQSSLPDGANAFILSSAEEKALGVFAGDAGAVDGAIGFGLSTTAWETLALVEIGHALGWSTAYYAGEPTVLDLYRYASAGQHQFTGGQPAYFSLDGGQTNAGTFATSFDYTLFSDQPDDPFHAPQTGATSSTLTNLDIEVLNLLGFGSQPVPVGYSLPPTGGPVAIVGFAQTNILGAQFAAGSGTILVDLKDGYVARGSTFDADLSNIQGVQLGADPSVVLGLASGTDLIYGGPGPMSFYGQGANDFIQGGTSANAVVGGTGNEVFYGNGGVDTMLAGSGANFMQAGAAAGSTDTFYGRGGADYVYGGAGTTALVGSTGYEQLTGSTTSAGLDILYGGSGTDAFYGGIGTNLFYEGSGKDAFAGTGGTDLIYGGSGESAVFGGAGSLAVTTGVGNQYVQAGSGRTYFNETAAGMHAGRYDQIDSFAGGQGTDLYLPTAVQGATSFVGQNGGTAVITAVNGGTAEIFAGGADLATVQNHTHFTL